MSDSFDPYLKWLGIRTSGRRVNHYRLLGLEWLESDTDVIAIAARRQIAHVESFADEHPDLVRGIVSELIAARDCLLSTELKARYDQEIKTALAARKTKQNSQPSVDAQVAGANVSSIDVRKQSIDSSPPDFSGLQIDSGAVPGGVDTMPAIRSDTSHRRRKSSGFDFAGWILGAIGAAAFGYVLLNTDLIDRIRGRQPQPVARVEEKDESEPVAEPKNTPATVVPRTDKSRPVVPLHSDSRATPRPRLASAEARGRDQNAEPLPVRKDPVPAARIKPRPIPQPKELESAKRKFQKDYKLQLQGNDPAVIRVLANNLASRIQNDVLPADQYVRLTRAMELAATTGDVQTIERAATQLQKRFLGVEFWETIRQPLLTAVDAGLSFEQVADDMDKLIQRARRGQQWDLCAELSTRAAKLASKSGDAMQRDMLLRFSKDMKSLDALGRKYETLQNKDVDGLSAKEKSDVGKYLCFGKQQWMKGLELVAQSNDSAMAAVAKSDLDSFGEASNAFAIAQAWATLSEKSKYKRADRRFMLERALAKIEESRGLTTIQTADEARNSIKRRTAVFKRYADLSHGWHARSAMFDVKGWATFDRAEISGGFSLMLSLGTQTRRLPIYLQNNVGVATTMDNKIRFEIRELDYGTVEMKIFDVATNQLRNVLYGN